MGYAYTIKRYAPAGKRFYPKGMSGMSRNGVRQWVGGFDSQAGGFAVKSSVNFVVAIEPGDETHAFGVVVPDEPHAADRAD